MSKFWKRWHVTIGKSLGDTSSLLYILHPTDTEVVKKRGGERKFVLYKSLGFVCMETKDILQIVARQLTMNSYYQLNVHYTQFCSWVRGVKFINDIQKCPSNNRRQNTTRMNPSENSLHNFLQDWFFFYMQICLGQEEMLNREKRWRIVI